MLVDLLLGLFQTAANGIADVFPTDNTDWVQYLETTAENLGALNYFLPIAETVALVVAVFALFPVFLGVTLALWVAAFLRGGSSVG